MQRVSELSSDLMGFAVGPNDVLYASGHPAHGEDGPFALALIESRDAGRTWAPVALSGVAGFHALDADEGGVYGFDAAGFTLRSARGGQEWREDGTDTAFVDLAADPTSQRVAGTTDGAVLMSSADGEAAFTPVESAPPLVLVDIGPDGRLAGIDSLWRVRSAAADGT